MDDGISFTTKIINSSEMSQMTMCDTNFFTS